MRITIETTDSVAPHAYKAILEVPYDDVVLDEVYTLINQVLQCAGYIVEEKR